MGPEAHDLPTEAGTLSAVLPSVLASLGSTRYAARPLIPLAPSRRAVVVLVDGLGDALLRRRSMADVDAWYERAARALHVEGHKPHENAVARHLLEELGFDPGLVDEAVDDPTTSDEVMADHNRVVDAGGYGVPTLFFPDGQCLFGPVLIDPPAGEAALRLWDAVVAWTEFPHLYELQRPKSTADQQAIAEAFRPYLEARDWVSINRGKVVGFDDLR